ncbi:MAG: asparaginase [Acidobacteria bacterium]|jgi:L-asparaginase|nr:asparaginase [Acidobacteriota bacterium]
MRLTILTTGGTIDKTYDEFQGSLRNEYTVIDVILDSLRLPDLEIRHVEVMHKDSLDMTDEDRQVIAQAVCNAAPTADAIVILHGTDTLSETGELLVERCAGVTIPVVLTGAMRPYEFRDTDALQNVIEALMASRLVDPGIYVVMHNRVLRFPGVVKDREALSFVRND